MQTQTTLSTVTRGGNRHSHGGRAPTRDVRTDAKQPSQHDRPTRHLFRASPPIRNPPTAQGKPTLHSLVCTTIKGVVSPDTAETALDRRRKPSSLRLRHIARKISLARFSKRPISRVHDFFLEMLVQPEASSLSDHPTTPT